MAPQRRCSMTKAITPPEGLDDVLQREQRAYNLLRFNPYQFPADFDWELAALGTYTKWQTERSDAALDQWDKAHPRIPSHELECFYELRKRGELSQRDFYSPTLSSQGFYRKRLNELNESGNQRPTANAPRRTKDDAAARMDTGHGCPTARNSGDHPNASRKRMDAPDPKLSGSSEHSLRPARSGYQRRLTQGRAEPASEEG